MCHSLSIHKQMLRGFHIPSTTEITVAIRSQFFFSKPLKFTPRRSFLPIMSMVFAFSPKKKGLKSTMAPVETQKAPVVVWMSDADEAEEDAGAAVLLLQTVQPSDTADSQP